MLVVARDVTQRRSRIGWGCSRRGELRLPPSSPWLRRALERHGSSSPATPWSCACPHVTRVERKMPSPGALSASDPYCHGSDVKRARRSQSPDAVRTARSINEENACDESLRDSGEDGGGAGHVLRTRLAECDHLEPLFSQRHRQFEPRFDAHGARCSFRSPARTLRQATTPPAPSRNKWRWRRRAGIDTFSYGG